MTKKLGGEWHCRSSTVQYNVCGYKLLWSIVKTDSSEMEVKRYLLECIPFAAMVIVECLDVGLTTLSKEAMSTKGMNHFIFVLYSNALATFILLPSYFLINRTTRPPLSFSLLAKFFFLGLVGYVCNCITLVVLFKVSNRDRMIWLILKHKRLCNSLAATTVVADYLRF